MDIFARITAVAVAAGFLAACGTADIANMSVKGEDFNKGLRDGYVKLANSEYDQTELSSGDDFSSRAKMAAMGKASAPEGISSRRLVPPHKAQLISARARLVSALGKGAAKVIPGQAAKAQPSFDCWMEQAEENIQPKDIAACRKQFNDAMKQVEAALAPKKKAKITVTGYADRAGNEDYNSILATKRANAVVAAFDKAGLKNPLSVAVFGEKSPAVKTGDGKRERLNRRVEVHVTQ